MSRWVCTRSRSEPTRVVVCMPLAGAHQQHGAGADPGLARSSAMDCCTPDDYDDFHELVHVRALRRVVVPLFGSGDDVVLVQDHVLGVKVHGRPFDRERIVNVKIVVASSTATTNYGTSLASYRTLCTSLASARIRELVKIVFIAVTVVLVETNLPRDDRTSLTCS